MDRNGPASGTLRAAAVRSLYLRSVGRERGWPVESQSGDCHLSRPATLVGGLVVSRGIALGYCRISKHRHPRAAGKIQARAFTAEESGARKDYGIGKSESSGRTA